MTMYTYNSDNNNFSKYAQHKTYRKADKQQYKCKHSFDTVSTSFLHYYFYYL
jgi:hypothetical protein